MAAITPIEAELARQKSIPDEVIGVFNNLIVKNLKDGRAIVSQDDVVSVIVSSMNVERHIVFKNSWLDVEPIFEEAGWSVIYDKPAYCETYKPYFEFKKRQK